MVKCPKCDKENLDDATGCKYCGHDLSKKKSSSNLGGNNSKLIIGVVAVIVIIAVIGVLASGMMSDTSTNDSVDNSKDTQSVDNSDDDSDSESDSTEYWASSYADKFHKPDCEWAQKISEDNKIIYDTREDAIADGKEPCTVCNP